jgi:hypothetical protein
MGFYIKPLGTPTINHPVPRDAAGADFHPSSVSIISGTHQNVRFVNYIIDQRNGSYSMKEGTYSPDHLVRTRNVLWDGMMAGLMKEDTTGLTSRNSRIRGLEDVRVYTDAKGVMRFLATSCEFSPKIRVVGGLYDTSIHDCAVLEPPADTDCEKNWLPVNGTDDIIYRWFPLQVGTLEENRMVVHTTHATPWFFSHLRGSASPIRVGGDLWVLTHFVEYSQPRKYFHCFVNVDPASYTPKAISLPFVFKASGIEYCLGCSLKGDRIEFAFSSWDDNPSTTSVSVSQFEWLQV